MSANVISHQEPRGKCERTRPWPVRRIGVLVATVIGIVAASWLAPESDRPASTPPAPPARTTGLPVPPPAMPELAAVDASVDLAGPPPWRTPRARPRRTGVPLDAAGELQSDGYEILSAAELDNISQARD